MNTRDVIPAMTRVFSELVDGTQPKGGLVLNKGDIGLLRSLDKLTAADASASTNAGATIAAHAQHLRFGLSLMNRWAAEGGDPFSDAAWDAAWKISRVDARAWDEIREGLRTEAHNWLGTLGTPRDANDIELAGLIASIAHLGYHLGAIRQIAKDARGPIEGSFS